MWERGKEAVGKRKREAGKSAHCEGVMVGQRTEDNGRGSVEMGRWKKLTLRGVRAAKTGQGGRCKGGRWETRIKRVTLVIKQKDWERKSERKRERLNPQSLKQSLSR